MVSNSNNIQKSQKEIYMRLYELYESFLKRYDEEFGAGLDPYDFTVLFNEVKEFNDLLERFRPNNLKFNPLKANEIKKKIALWYEDGPAFMSSLLRIKYRPIYEKSKRILYEIAKQFVHYPSKMTDVTKQIPKDLDKIFEGITSSDPTNGYAVVGKPVLDKFVRGNVSMPMLKKLWARYVLTGVFDSKQMDYESFLEINEAKRKGFWNPFDNWDSSTYEAPELDYSGRKRQEEINAKKDNILNIEVWDKAKRINKVEYKNGRMIATSVLFPNDILERDPVKIVPNTELSSKEIRDMAFEVIPNRLYGISIGYATLYRRSDEVSKEPNAEYTYDKANQMITIRVLSKISKGEEVILKGKYEGFGNLYKKDTFNMDPVAKEEISKVDKIEH